MNRRHFIKSISCYLTTLSSFNSWSMGQKLILSKNSNFESLIEGLAAECRSLDNNRLSDSEWHRKIDHLLTQYDHRQLKTDVSLEKSSKEIQIISGKRKSLPLKDLRIEKPFAPYQLRYSIWAIKKGSSEPPHAHNNVISMDVVLTGSARLRQFNRINDESNHLTIRKTIDKKKQPGDTGLVTDNLNNIHWYDALEDTYVFNISVVNSKPEKLYKKTANKWGGIYLDIDHSVKLENDTWRTPTIGFVEATKKYGNGANITI